MELFWLSPSVPWKWLIFSLAGISSRFLAARETIHVSKLAVWAGNLFYTETANVLSVQICMGTGNKAPGMSPEQWQERCWVSRDFSEQMWQQKNNL